MLETRIDPHPSSGSQQYSCVRKIDAGMVRTDNHQTTGPQEKRSVVIALPASNRNQQIKNEKKRKRREETESEKREEVESQSGKESDEEEQWRHWSHDFAKQLIDLNEGGVPTPDEQITMIPNLFFKDLLQL